MNPNHKNYTYMCKECTDKEGVLWPEKCMATMKITKCNVCNKEQSLCCITEWNWPGIQIGVREF